MTASVTALTRAVIVAAAPLIFLMLFSAIPLPIAQAGEGCVPDQVHEVPTQFGGNVFLDWGPTIVVWLFIIVIGVAIALYIYLRIMAWIRKWG